MVNDKKTCGEYYRETMAEFCKFEAPVSRQELLTAFAAGVVYGQAEKVFLGACPAAMFRPRPENFSAVLDASQLIAATRFGLQVRVIEYFVPAKGDAVGFSSGQNISAEATLRYGDAGEKEMTAVFAPSAVVSIADRLEARLRLLGWHQAADIAHAYASGGYFKAAPLVPETLRPELERITSDLERRRVREIWIYKPRETYRFGRWIHDPVNSSVWHLHRAMDCGIPNAESDPFFHERSGAYEVCDEVLNKGA